MRYQEIKPDTRLMPYIKCYYLYESDTEATFDDTVFPSGNLEIIFNLGSGAWQTAEGAQYITTPSIELWGQITRPLPIRSIGKNTMLGIRFFPHAAAYFLDDNISVFNNQVSDFGDISGPSIRTLHAQLQECGSWPERIALIEAYLCRRFSLSGKRTSNVTIVHHIMQELRKDDFFDNISNVALRYGISSRYLQKLFLQYTGLTPKLYSKIHRFQNSLQLLSKKDSSLTAIAYDCGYFDQSHFIREFRAFTGATPSGYAPESSPITLAATLS